MKRFLWFFLAVPLAIVLIVFSVANRVPVTMILDPFSRDNPAVALSLPFFVFLFAAFMTGMVTGAILTWFGQGRHRKAARLATLEAVKWRKDAEAQKNRADLLASAAAPAQGLPMLPAQDRAA